MPAVERHSFDQRRSFLVKALAVAASILIAWGIISAWREAAARSLEPLGLATDLATARRGASSDAAELATRARADPMASAPFVDAALIADRDGRGGEAEAIMNHAARLDPRNPSARAWLFAHDLHNERYASAIGHALVLYQLEPALEPTLSRTLAILAQLDDLRALIRQQFRSSPYLGSILAAAPKGSLSQVASLELIAALAPPARAGWQEQYLNDLLAKQDFAGVSRALRNFGIANRTGDNLLYDGLFEQKTGPLPFNWALTSDADIHAAPVETGLPAVPTALHLERFGVAAATGAKQSILVHPGRYRLSHLLKAADLAPDGTGPAPFLWLVSCPGLPHPDLARFPIGPDVPPRWTLSAWTFEVPASCGLIVLSLTSSFSDTAVHADALLTRVRLTPVG